MTNILTKAKEAFEQSERKQADWQRQDNLAKERNLRGFLKRSFDGATPEDFAAQNLIVRWSMYYDQHSIQIQGICPDCGEIAWSDCIYDFAGLGEMLNGNFRSSPSHTCHSAESNQALDTARELRDVLIRFLELDR